MAQTAGYFQYYDSTARASKVKGVDIAHYQYDEVAPIIPINWTTMYNYGARFVMNKSGGVYGSFSARYIKCTVNGSYTNSSSIFNEVKIIDLYGTNHATGKTVTGSVGVPQSGTYPLVVDGNLANFVIVGDNTQWVQVDLGSVINLLSYVQIWHYYADGRKFKDNKIEYSSDGTNWTTLFLGTAGNGQEYAEKSSGAMFYHWTGVSKDPMFLAANLSAARAAGLKVGAYYFKNPCHMDSSGINKLSVSDAQADATSFYNFIVGQLGSTDMGDIFPMLDWENQNGDMYPAVLTDDAGWTYIDAFVTKFKQLSGGRQVILYTAFYTLDSLDTNGSELVHSTNGGIGTKCPLWLSSVVDTYPSSGFTAFGGFVNDKWTVWQYNFTNTLSDEYGLPAVNASIDQDLLEGSIYTIMPPSKITGLTGIAASESATISWNYPPDDDIVAYKVYIDDSYIASGATNSATITGMTNGTTYKIEVSAIDAWEEGKKSDPVYITPESGTVVNVVDYVPVTETGAIVFYQASGEGDEFENDGKTVVMVKNDSAAAISVNIDSIKPDNFGNDHNLSISVAAGTIKVIGAFNHRRFNRPSGRIKMTYSSFTDVSLMVAKFQKAKD